MTRTETKLQAGWHWRWVVIITLGLLISGAQAQTPTTTTAVAEFYLEILPDEVSVGDAVHLTLRSRVPGFSDDQIQNITMNADPARWHVDAQWRRDWKGQVQNKTGPWHAKLRPFELGTVALPEIKVAFTTPEGNTLETVLTTQTLEVKSVRANPTSTELIGLRDPLPLKEDWRWLWYVAGGVVLGALLIYLLLKWLERRKHVGKPSAPPLPPGLWALEELDRRSRLPVCRTGPAKLIFSLVSEVVRLYLGRRYGFNAIDLTTAECLHALRGAGVLTPPPEVLRWVEEFLQECDLVKFTTIEPAPERWTQIWNDARLIVTQTTPPEELETAPVAVRKLALGPGAGRGPGSGAGAPEPPTDRQTSGYPAHQPNSTLEQSS